MTKNVGKVDKIIRISAALIIGLLYYLNIISGNLGIGLLVVAGILVVTSSISFCGLYTLFGINTCPIKQN